MKGPTDVEEREGELAASGRAAGERGVRRKVFLRQEAFLDARGLSYEAQPLEIADAEVPPTTGQSYVQAMRDRATMLGAAPPPAELTWRSLGPAGIPHGQTYGTGPGSSVTVSGRVPAIAVDPNNPARLLVGSAAGGIWETRDGGMHWAPRTDDQPTLSIGALAFDPSDVSTVYAGTGEGNSEYASLGQGLLVSHDGGSSWTQVAEQVFAGVGFYKIAVDPAGGGRLLVATTGGAAETPDGGATWSLLHRGLTWDVSLAQHHAGAEEILLAAPDGLFAVQNGGAFAKVNLPGLPALDARRERMAVAHVPSDPGQAFVFAATGGVARLWHRPGRTAPWARIDLPSFSLGQLVDDVLAVDQAAYDWYVAVPGDGDTTVYLGAKELVRGVRTGDKWEWEDISTRIDQGDSIHPDQHTMAFDPSNPAVIYAGSDGGIFRSPDGGDTWRPLNAGLAISEVEYLTQRPDEQIWMLAGLQDNGTIRRQSPDLWTQVGLGDGGDCGTDMSHPDTCYHSYYHMHLERSDHRGDPASWKRVTPPGDPNAPQQLFYPPVEVNGSVVVKAGHTVHLSRDAGRNWNDIDLEGGQRSIASALAIPDPDTVLVGTIEGDVSRIVFANGKWSDPTTLARPRNGWISDLLVDPRNAHRYWVTFSNPGAVFRSDDDGAHWTDVTANLPAIPVNAVITDPGRDDRLWVACDVGVFESVDAGGHWAVYGTGLPNSLAVDLLFHEAAHVLRVGTRSRGVWEVPA
ncbi:hypothetical protein [Kribbella sp. NPDC004875]|uniref:hypothetical protein n=1 Tax=Kribbella sp. NPDC004875 TaxID=3364107 RepID=UPI0036BF6EC1